MPSDAEPTTHRKTRRSNKVCRRCHARKSRCDVQLRHPCSACVHATETCVIRRRKNARYSHEAISLALPHAETFLIAISRARSVTPTTEDTTTQSSSAPLGQQWPLDLAMAVLDPNEPYPGGQHDFDGNSAAPANGNGENGNGDYSFTTLEDLEAIFSAGSAPTFAPPFMLDSHVTLVARPDAERTPGSLQPPHSLGLAHQDFLYACGCFALPPAPILHQMMQSYFKYIHPNLPILDESEIWSLWVGDAFSSGSFSLLLMRAMLFSISQFLTPEMLSIIGHSSAREARMAYYNQAKLLFDFEQEIDPMISAQACLLLTYFSPHENTFQVNSYWLVNAARLARIAGAHNFFLKPMSSDRSRSLKKLWWGVLFRDTILSLGLRRTPVVELDLQLDLETHSLTADDFAKDLGHSRVHERSAQLRLFEVIQALCRLVMCLHPGLKLLYRYEVVADRIIAMRDQTATIMADVEFHLHRLYHWADQTSRSFPSPITLDEDEVSGSVSIFANMLFCYHASAVFAFDVLRLLLLEIGSSPAADVVTTKQALEGMDAAIDDFGARLKELLQARLGRYLPISVSAFAALPLVLQAINVSAARNIEAQEHLEARKLAVFQRTIELQRTLFDGSEFIFDTLANVSAYAVKENLVPPTAGSRSSTSRSAAAGRAAASHWSTIAQIKRRPFLRLLLRLDRILCTGGQSIDNDDDDCLGPLAAREQESAARSET